MIQHVIKVVQRDLDTPQLAREVAVMMIKIIEVGPDNVDEVEVGREVGVEAEIEGDGDIVAVGVGVEIVHMENDSQVRMFLVSELDEFLI